MAKTTNTKTVKQETTAAKKAAIAGKTVAPSALQLEFERQVKANAGKPTVQKGVLAQLPGAAEQYAATHVLKPTVGEAAAVDAAGNPIDPTAPRVPTLEEWLSSDGTYLDSVNSLGRARDDALTDSAKQRADYDNTYDDDLYKLGYNADTKTWNMNDSQKQSGRLFSGQANDFAARGMLQSSGYGDAVTNTTRQLNGQVADAAASRSKYRSDLDAYDAAQRSSAEDSITRAKREAIARRASQYATAASGVLS